MKQESTTGLGMRCQWRLSVLITHSFGGSWTQEKLEILRRYLDAYTTALKNQPFSLIYIDAFAGPGNWMPGSSYDEVYYGEYNDMLKGSPQIALDIVDKPFDEFIFIDTNPEHIEALETVKVQNPDRVIKIFNHDANTIIPQVCDGLGRYERAVVFLDPYATEVSWSTVYHIAQTRKVDCWILFPLMAITRQMPRNREPDRAWMENIDRVFGEQNFWKNFYTPARQASFFGQGNEREREQGSDQIAEAYRERLKTVFVRVAPTRRVLKNSTNSNLFDLFFAASNPRGADTAVKIANYILKHW